VESVTPTNVVIRPVNDPTAEPWNVSIQRVSKCSSAMSSSSPWFGHSGRNIRYTRQGNLELGVKIKRQLKLILNNLFRPDVTDPSDRLPDTRTMLYHKVHQKRWGKL